MMVCRGIVPVDVMADAFHFDVELGFVGILTVVRWNVGLVAGAAAEVFANDVDKFATEVS